jgi:hypothetical protein
MATYSGDAKTTGSIVTKKKMKTKKYHAQLIDSFIHSFIDKKQETLERPTCTWFIAVIHNTLDS